MEAWHESVVERHDRGGWRQHRDQRRVGPVDGILPAPESKLLEVMGSDELRSLPPVDDHRAHRELAHVGNPIDAVGGPVDTPPRSKPLSGQASVQIIR